MIQMGLCIYIKMNNCQDYHQISAREKDRYKLAFFTPDGEKKAFKLLLLDLKTRQYLHRYNESFSNQL